MDPLEQLTREVRRSLGEGPGPERRRQQRRAAARLTAGPPGHVPWRRWALPLIAVAALLLWVWIGRAAPGSLEARMGDRPFAAGSWLRALTTAVREGVVRGGPPTAEGATSPADPRTGPTEVVEPTPSPGPASAPDPEPASAVSPRPPALPAWRRLAASGEHAAALAAVERAGLAAVLERADAESLEQLAHSARLANAAEPARRALQALRRRFPRDARARMAAFLLGRVALEQEKDPDAAASWFSVYLQEQPSGPLIEEARGRILELRRHQGDPAAVQAAARAYIEHHPEGSRARLARALLDPP